MLAFIVKRRDFREVDQIISVYTQTKGRLDLLAKGLKKIISKHSGNLLAGALVEIDVATGKEIDYLTKVQPVEMFKEIRIDIKKNYLTSYILNLLVKVIAVEEKDENIFKLLKSWLEFMQKTEVVNEMLVYGFIIKLFSYLGFTPGLEACVKCIKEDNYTAFDLKNGGLICQDCYQIDKEIIKLSQKQINNLLTLFYKDWPEINNLKFDKIINELVYNFVQYHSEIKLPKLSLKNYASTN